MAKLGARGRKELARMEKERAWPSDLTNWDRKTVAFMEDGTILRKVDVRFRSDGRRHSYGWTVFCKDQGISVEKFVAAFEKQGYKRVK